MKHILLTLFLASISLMANAQTLTNSNLPIVLINTDTDPFSGQPQVIEDSYKVWAQMKIIYRPDGSRNYLVDQNDTNLLNYNGRIKIEIRGSSSQSSPKKAYGLTTYKNDNLTTNNVSILGMPNENDWILYAIVFDPSLIRSYLSYDLARSMGNYAPRAVYCEVIINGDYKGLYVFLEKIKIDSERVNITKMKTTDISLPDLSGGYLTKADKTTGGDPVAWTMASYNGTTSYIHENPKPTEITSQQNNYIFAQFNNLQTAASTGNASITNGYPSIIDVPSFIDFMIMSEISSNADSYQFSTYFHKERNGKLRAGPIWDFDLTYGNDLFFWGYNRSHYDIWQFDNGDNTGSKFWKDLFNNATFRCYLSRRWNEVTVPGGPLNYSVISAKIDQIVARISEAQYREYTRWGTSGTFTSEISQMKNWLKSRISWMNSRLESYQACATPVVPPLVITRINYNPMPSQAYTSDDLEFVEISNNSDRPLDLTGVYFKELGFTYNFPPGSTLAPYDRLFLAANMTAFSQVYGVRAFGQFTRNLSNNSENLVLVDAFGNLIDKVEYKDSAPWPVEADGEGYYLQLVDINSDNSLASNWVISSRMALGTQNSFAEKTIILYPNPARTNLTVESGTEQLACYEIYDLNGRLVKPKTEVTATRFTVTLEELLPNTYIVKLYYPDGETVIKKLTKLP